MRGMMALKALQAQQLAADHALMMHRHDEQMQLLQPHAHEHIHTHHVPHAHTVYQEPLPAIVIEEEEGSMNPSSQSWMLILLLMFAAGFAVAGLFVVLILTGVLAPGIAETAATAPTTGVIP